jgi:3-deoxy-D-manno-octulosonate 8-phosphate phosphatase (KDO 8-P phosphatase)
MRCIINKNLRYLVNHRSLTINYIASKTGIAETLLDNFISDSAIPDVVSAISLADFFKLPLDLFLTEEIEKKETILSSFNFKFLVVDIDGVMTDGGIIYTESGDEIKKFNAKDGLAIIRLTEAGTNVGFLSSGFTKNIIEKRAQVLGVQYVYVGTWKKLEVLEKWCNELNIGLQNVAYIGDDINDLAIIEKVGCSACPTDAISEIKKKVNIVLSAKGGKGCVREFVDNYLNSFTKNPF